MVVCGFSSILFHLRSLISVGMAVTIHQLKVRWVHPRTFCDVFCEKPFCERIRNKFVLFDRFMAVVKPFKYLSFMKNRHFIQMISFSWMIPIAVESSKTVMLQPSGFFFKPQEKAAALMMGIIAGIFLLCKGIYLRCIILFSFASGQNSCNDHEFIIPILVLKVCCQPLGLLLLQEGHFKEIKQHIGCVLLTKRILWNAEGNWEQRHQTRAIRTNGKTRIQR